MRLIDADALEKEGWSLHRTVRVDMHTSEYQIKPIAKVPTIDHVRKGKWIDKHAGIATCSECGDRWGVHSMMKFCPSCGAKMEEGEQP